MKGWGFWLEDWRCRLAVQGLGFRVQASYLRTGGAGWQEVFRAERLENCTSPKIEMVMLINYQAVVVYYCST